MIKGYCSASMEGVMTPRLQQCPALLLPLLEGRSPGVARVVYTGYVLELLVYVSAHAPARYI